MVQFFNPQNESDIKRKRMMAEQLKALSKPQETQMVSGIAIPNSPLSGLAQALGQVGAASQEMDVSNLERKDAMDKQRFMADLIKNSGNDPQALAQGLLANPSTADAGLSLYTKNLEAQNDAAKWEKEAALKRELASMRNRGGAYLDPQTGEIIQPERKLSSTEQKAFNEQQDKITNLETSQDAFNQIKEYQGKPMYSGFGAEAKAFANRLPIIGELINDEKAANTTAYQNLIKTGQYKQLAVTFPGAISNSEREALEKLGALASYDPREQAKIVADSEIAISKLLAKAKQRASSIASGSQYKEAIQPSPQPSQGGWSIEEIP